MKRLIVLLLAISLFSVSAFAQGPGNTGQQMGIETAGNAAQLGEMIQEQKQVYAQELEDMPAQQRNVYMNQNRVREAVHALLAMENLTGGIGQQVSEIARNFNNSVQATIRAEEKVQSRNMITKFLFGGDEEAGAEIESEVSQNMARIEELKQLRDQCECDEEVRSMLQEQIQNMELEQNRLRELAQNEIRNKGILGWLFR